MSLLKLGGMNVLRRLIEYAAPGGHLNRDRAYALFSRQESVRQFVNIIANGGVQGLQRFTDSLDQAAKTNFADVAARQRLQYSGTHVRARTAVSNLGVALASGADPVLENLYARPITYLSNAAIRHPKVTAAAVDTGLALGAANALRRYGAMSGLGARLGGRFGRLGKVVSGATGIEQGLISSAISKEELPAAIGGGAADGSRANPYWVIISPLSWSVGSPGGFQSPTGRGNTLNEIESDAKKYGGWGALAAQRLKRFARIGGRFGGPATIAAIALAQRGDQGQTYPQMLGPRRDTLVNRYYNAIYGHPELARGLPPLNGRIRNIIGHALRGNLSSDDAERLLAGKHGVRWFERMQQGTGGGMFNSLSAALDRSFRKTSLFVEGVARVEVDITQLDAQGKRHTLRRGVDVKLIPARSFPTKQGQPGSRRGGHH
jgi:hypothetical protein